MILFLKASNMYSYNQFIIIIRHFIFIDALIVNCRFEANFISHFSFGIQKVMYRYVYPT